MASFSSRTRLFFFFFLKIGNISDAIMWNNNVYKVNSLIIEVRRGSFVAVAVLKLEFEWKL